MHNNNLTWLWEEVDILMPTIYTPTNGTPGSTGSAGIAARVRGLFTEAERLINLVSSARAAKGRPDLEIVPWVWERYDNNPKTFLSEQDLKSLFAVPFEFPHTGTYHAHALLCTIPQSHPLSSHSCVVEVGRPCNRARHGQPATEEL